MSVNQEPNLISLSLFVTSGLNTPGVIFGIVDRLIEDIENDEDNGGAEFIASMDADSRSDFCVMILNRLLYEIPKLIQVDK